MNENRRKIYILTVNSFILFILAYLIVHIPVQFGTHLVATAFNIPTKFEFFKIDFPIQDHSYLWTFNSIISIYITGPVIALLLAFFSIRYFILFSEKKSIEINLLLIWMYAHCINIFLGGLVVGIPLIKGFGFVPNWMYAGNELSVALIIISLLLLLGNGYILRKAFFSLYYNSLYYNSPFHSLVFKLFIVFVPYVVANVLFFLIHFPDNSLYERLTAMVMFIQLVGIIPYTSVYVPEEHHFKPVRFAYRGLLMLVVLFLALVLWKIFHNHFVYQVN